VSLDSLHRVVMHDNKQISHINQVLLINYNR